MVNSYSLCLFLSGLFFFFKAILSDFLPPHLLQTCFVQHGNVATFSLQLTPDHLLLDYPHYVFWLHYTTIALPTFQI